MPQRLQPASSALRCGLHLTFRTPQPTGSPSLHALPHRACHARAGMHSAGAGRAAAARAPGHAGGERMRGLRAAQRRRVQAPQRVGHLAPGQPAPEQGWGGGFGVATTG